MRSAAEAQAAKTPYEERRRGVRHRQGARREAQSAAEAQDTRRRQGARLACVEAFMRISVVALRPGASSASVRAALTCARAQVSVDDVVDSSAGASSAIGRETVARHETAVRCERSPHAARSSSISHREAAMHHEAIIRGAWRSYRASRDRRASSTPSACESA